MTIVNFIFQIIFNIISHNQLNFNISSLLFLHFLENPQNFMMELAIVSCHRESQKKKWLLTQFEELMDLHWTTKVCNGSIKTSDMLASFIHRIHLGLRLLLSLRTLMVLNKRKYFTIIFNYEFNFQLKYVQKWLFLFTRQFKKIENNQL